MAYFTRTRVPYPLRKLALEYHQYHGDDNPRVIALLTYVGKDYDVPVILTRFTDRQTGDRMCTLLDVVGCKTKCAYVVEEEYMTCLVQDEANMIYRWKCIMAAEQEDL